MIHVTSTPKYSSTDKKMVLYESQVVIEVDDTCELMAELQCILKSVITNVNLKLTDAAKIAEIMNEEAENLSKKVIELMGCENNDQNKTT